MRENRILLKRSDEKEYRYKIKYKGRRKENYEMENINVEIRKTNEIQKVADKAFE